MKNIEALWTILIVLWVVGSAVLKIWKKGKLRSARERAQQMARPQAPAQSFAQPRPAPAVRARPVQRAPERPMPGQSAPGAQTPDLTFLKDTLASLGIEVPAELQKSAPANLDLREVASDWSGTAREEVNEARSWDEDVREVSEGRSWDEAAGEESVSEGGLGREEGGRETTASEEYQPVEDHLDAFWEQEKARDSWHQEQRGLERDELRRLLPEAMVLGSILAPPRGIRD